MRHAKGLGLLLLSVAAAQAKPALFFMESRGQAEKAVRFVVKTPEMTAYLKAAGTEIRSGDVITSMRFLGANTGVRMEGRRMLAGHANFLLGSDRNNWRTSVPLFGEVIGRMIYPGIDVVYSGSDGVLKSDFHVAPGADPARIRWKYNGGTHPKIEDSGALVLTTSAGILREAPPDAYQQIAGKRRIVAASYQVFIDGSVGFALGPYEATEPLIIDPVLSSSTPLGGSGLDSATSTALDDLGNIYVAGWTDSFDLRTSNPLRSATGGGVDAFVAKFNPDGKTLVYCTYLGGNGDDRARGIAVDGAGNAYITGWTGSSNYPLERALQTTLGGGRDAFVAKLNPSGNTLVFSTYFGGSRYESGNSIAIDGAGSIFISGETTSGDLPVSNAFQGANRGLTEAFVMKLAPDGNSVGYSTYIGGDGDDRARDITIDNSGNAFITGETASSNFPVANAIQPVLRGKQDAFVTKISPAGNLLVYSTYLGGINVAGQPESGASIAVDGSGHAYVTGTTCSFDFPVLNAFQSQLSGSLDAFVAKISPQGSGLVYSTYLGGSNVDHGMAISVSDSGSVYVAGYTASSNFPLADPFQSTLGGVYDGFAVQFAPDGRSLAMSTYLGGSESDAVHAMALKGEVIYLAGQTASWNFPVQETTQRIAYIDGFVARLTPTPKYGGYLDALSCEAIEGWAWDKAQPNAPVSIEIYDGSALLATIVANQFRQDLLNAGIGTGQYGFRYALPPYLRDGIAHAYTLKIAGSDYRLVGSPRTMTCRAYVGFKDEAGCGVIQGWAWDPNQPNAAVNVDLYDGANKILTFPANQFRQDLLALGLGNGYHGFSLPLPDQLKDGNAHEVGLKFSQTGTFLINSPRSVSCSVYEGFHDEASCSAIRGWAWDKNRPNFAINVDLYDSGTLVATVPANQFRSDLLAIGKGNGYHGFSFPLPQQLKDGLPHLLGVKFGQTGAFLGNSQKWLSCASYEGFDDGANCSVISGWAWDRSQPDSPVDVAIYDGDALLAVVSANQFRSDLKAIGKGNGYHGYSFPVPAAMKDGRTHTIRVRYAGDGAELHNTGRTLSCQ